MENVVHLLAKNAMQIYMVKVQQILFAIMAPFKLSTCLLAAKKLTFPSALQHATLNSTKLKDLIHALAARL